MVKIDEFDRKILNAMQVDASIPQRELAEQVGLSQNACWRRLQRLQAEGVLLGRTINLSRKAIDLSLVVFVLIRTRHHSRTWLDEFRRHVSTVPEVIDFFRIGGDYDYLLKVVTTDMESFDEVYLRLISAVELDSVTSLFAMEVIEENRPYPLTQNR